MGWIIDLNIKVKAMKLLEKNIGGYHGILVVASILRWDIERINSKTKIKLNFIKF